CCYIARASEPVSVHLCFCNGTAPSEIYTLSLHDALPICEVAEEGRGDVRHADRDEERGERTRGRGRATTTRLLHGGGLGLALELDRKSTRLNSSHVKISYAVFCLKKKTPEHRQQSRETD